MTEGEILNLVSSSQEFDQIKVRRKAALFFLAQCSGVVTDFLFSTDYFVVLIKQQYTKKNVLKSGIKG